MFELAALHAAARARRVLVRRRDGAVVGHARGDAETPRAFLARLFEGRGDASAEAPWPGADEAVFAALFRRDRDLGQGSVVYALFDERAGERIAASALLV